MQFLPKQLSDKIVGICGLILTAVGIGVSIAQGFNAADIVSMLGGVSLAVKGFEEFINGNVAQGAVDVQSGVKEVKASEPEAKVDALTIAKEVEADPAKAVAVVAPQVPAIEAVVKEAEEVAK
jgi:hypothetical protein